MKKSKYVVIRPNTKDFKLGEVVSLTEAQSLALVNKIKPFKEKVDIEVDELPEPVVDPVVDTNDPVIDGLDDL